MNRQMKRAQEKAERLQKGSGVDRRAAPPATTRRAAQQEKRKRAGVRQFLREVRLELKKVDWPGQHQLVQGTAVVIIACLITGVYLFLADELFRRFVQHVLLGG